MPELLEFVPKLLPVIQSSPSWVRVFFTIWLIASAALVASVFLTYNTSPTANGGGPDPVVPAGPDPVVPAGQWPITGDVDVDRAHRELNKLLTSNRYNEGQIAGAIRQIFYKPFFKHMGEHRDHGRDLFSLCRAQLLLQKYVSNFSDPSHRLLVVDATQNLTSLQGLLIKLYGPTAQEQILCENSSNDLKTYLANLPPRVQNRLDDAELATAQTIHTRLRENLKRVGLID